MFSFANAAGTDAESRKVLPQFYRNPTASGEMNVDPNKRGNPPFEPSSYAAGLERRVKRHEAWARDARDAARMLLDGNATDAAFGRSWWRKQLDQPEVVLSGGTQG